MMDMGLLVRDHNGNTLEIDAETFETHGGKRLGLFTIKDLDRKRIVRARTQVTDFAVIVTLDLLEGAGD